MLSSSGYTVPTFGTADLKSSVGEDYYSYYRGDLKSFSIYTEKLDIGETVGLFITCEMSSYQFEISNRRKKNKSCSHEISFRLNFKTTRHFDGHV